MPPHFTGRWEFRKWREGDPRNCLKNLAVSNVNLSMETSYIGVLRNHGC